MPKSFEDWKKLAADIEIDPRPFIGAGRIAVDGNNSFSSINPYDGSVVATYANCDEGIVGKAVEQAETSFSAGTWSRAAIAERAVVLNQWADKVAENADLLALLDSLEMGMPIANAAGDVEYSADFIRETASLGLSLTSPTGVTAPGTLNLNMIEPLGVIAAITPWNFPVNQVLVRIVPALVMGNSVVLKPSEVASASALRLADLALEAGLPAGVLNVVTGTGAQSGTALVRDPRVSRIAFTGSTGTGARIQALAAEAGVPKPMTMELGGKSPHIVCASFDEVADLAPLIAQNIFWNSGQVCSAGSLLIVHEDKADALIQAVLEHGKGFTPGHPLDPNTQFGPIATSGQYKKVQAHLSNAKDEGAHVYPAYQTSDGLFVAPTLVDSIAPKAAIAREEIFGPVLAVARYTELSEAIELANSSGFGLIATAWTKDLGEGHGLARALKAGSVTINSSIGVGGEISIPLGLEPVGKSGFGADYGFPGLMQFAHAKMIAFNTH